MYRREKYFKVHGKSKAKVRLRVKTEKIFKKIINQI